MSFSMMDSSSLQPRPSLPLQFKLDGQDFLLSPCSSKVLANSTSPTKKSLSTPAPCNFEALSMHFHLPLKVAAEKFGVRATAFKKRCRAIGIRHWPYRKVRSLKRSLQELSRCKDQGSLTEKQQVQYANFKRQLDKLLSPETYGIDPSRKSVAQLSLNFDDDDDIESGDGEDSAASAPNSPMPGSVSHGHKRMKTSNGKASYVDHRLSHTSKDGVVYDSSLDFFNGDTPSVSVRFGSATGGAFDAYDHMLHEYKSDLNFGIEDFGNEDYTLPSYAIEHEEYDDVFFHPAVAQRSATFPASCDDVYESSHTFDDDVFQQISPDYGCLV